MKLIISDKMNKPKLAYIKCEPVVILLLDMAQTPNIKYEAAIAPSILNRFIDMSYDLIGPHGVINVSNEYIITT